ncbi:MAG: polysaccharide biosynthesis/export family protein [Cyclobacteriaceae bacterium]|nr:polysaccharide biosynthesis/export family protein [Cyclobacteriaceae bacterium]
MVIRQLAILFLASLIFSCVSNKKVLYLQTEETDLYGPAIPDSILRVHDILPFEYKLQHEDVLSIQISSLTPAEYDFFSQGLPQNQMNMGASMSGGALFGYLIDKNGEIEFPVVGKLKFAGLNIYEAEEKVRVIAEEYLEEPVVKVRLLNFRYTVVGEIASRGRTVNTYNNRLSMMEAIGLAGGMGELADLQNVKVVRQVENKASVYYVNLLDEKFIESPYYYVHPNDIIVVPPLKQRPFRMYFGQNLSLIISSLSLLLLVISLIPRN